MKMFSPIRLFVFGIAVYALSVFFEAGRLISSSQSLVYIPMIIFSVLALVSSLFVIGYWIYTEEKEKNNLANEFAPYEYIYRVLSMRKMQK